MIQWKLGYHLSDYSKFIFLDDDIFKIIKSSKQKPMLIKIDRKF